MVASSYLKRIKWRQAYRDSVSESVTFASKLDEIEASIATEVEGGKDVSSTTTGTSSVSFFKGVDPHDRASFILELQDVYAEAERNLIAAGTPVPTDLEIKAEGEAYLKPITEYTADFSGIHSEAVAG